MADSDDVSVGVAALHQPRLDFRIRFPTDVHHQIQRHHVTACVLAHVVKVTQNDVNPDVTSVDLLWRNLWVDCSRFREKVEAQLQDFLRVAQRANQHAASIGAHSCVLIGHEVRHFKMADVPVEDRQCFHHLCVPIQQTHLPDFEVDFVVFIGSLRAPVCHIRPADGNVTEGVQFEYDVINAEHHDVGFRHGE